MTLLKKDFQYRKGYYMLWLGCTQPQHIPHIFFG